MMKYVNGKRMEESDLCMMLEDLGVVLDRATWTHFKDAFAKSQVNDNKTRTGEFEKNFETLFLLKIQTFVLNQYFLAEKENVPPAGPSSMPEHLAPEEADSESSQRSSIGKNVQES